MKWLACFSAILLCTMLTNGVFSQQPVKPSAKIDKAGFVQLTDRYDQLQRDLKELELKRAQINRLMNDYNERLKAVTGSVQALEQDYDKLVSANGNIPSQHLGATKQMQDMQKSFALQYQLLQQQMQRESRQYTSVSNVMKTKHDTVKNSISNVK